MTLILAAVPAPDVKPDADHDIRYRGNSGTGLIHITCTCLIYGDQYTVIGEPRRVWPLADATAVWAGHAAAARAQAEAPPADPPAETAGDEATEGEQRD